MQYLRDVKQFETAAATRELVEQGKEQARLQQEALFEQQIAGLSENQKIQARRNRAAEIEAKVKADDEAATQGFLTVLKWVIGFVIFVIYVATKSSCTFAG